MGRERSQFRAACPPERKVRRVGGEGEGEGRWIWVVWVLVVVWVWSVVPWPCRVPSCPSPSLPAGCRSRLCVTCCDVRMHISYVPA